VAEAADRIIEIADGTIVSDEIRSTRTVPALAEPRAGASAASLVADAGEALRQARRGLGANLIRTALTLTGIIIGVASVIALMAIGEGTKQTVLEQLAAYGTNRLYVSPGSTSGRGPGGTLSVADVELVRTVPNVAAAMPYVSNRVTVRYGNIDARVPAAAVGTEYPRMLSWPLARGGFFTQNDERSLATVAVIGQTLWRTLFPNGDDPLGKFILVNDIPFQVIGLLSEKGATTGDADDDKTIVIPYATGSQRLFGSPYLSWISVLVDDIEKAQQTTDDITALLTASHRVQDFSVYNRAASIAAEMKTQSSLTLQLGFTAAISLLVGGIGVMNMMLMSVAERTREIGIRIAMGARTIDIKRQFLTEALMLTAAGGCLGFLLGHLAGIAAVLFGTRVIFTAHAAAAALLCSVAVGLVFGFMPARRAARLDPVVALSRE
jgi:macrolide transport system ATP-binding/permease protein